VVGKAKSSREHRGAKEKTSASLFKRRLRKESKVEEKIFGEPESSLEPVQDILEIINS